MIRAAENAGLLLAVIIGVFVTSVWAVSANATGPGWRLKRSQKQAHYVWVRPERMMDEQVYRNAINAVCARSVACGIIFWSDNSLIPPGPPYAKAHTKEQQAGVIAQYVRNHQEKLDRLLLNCRQIGEPFTSCLNL